VKIMQALRRIVEKLTRGEATLPPSPASPRKANKREVLAAATEAIKEADRTCEVHDRESGILVETGKAVLLVAALALGGCAAPASDQGQGGSTGQVPTVQNIINIGTGGGVTANPASTVAPTAAPASSASAAQTATTDVKPAIGTDAIKAAVPGTGAVDSAVKVLGGDGTVKPEPKPGE
jgi:hypothetical protein